MSATNSTWPETQVSAGVNFAGTLVDNPYFASVGLTGRAVDERLSGLPNLLFRRSGDVVELEWHGRGVALDAALETRAP